MFNSGVSIETAATYNGSNFGTVNPFPKFPDAKFGFILFKVSLKQLSNDATSLLGHVQTGYFKLNIVIYATLTVGVKTNKLSIIS
uniref:CSON006911 protein n=1 Tax=Culicoides sonorensis TaxID=179676 RepID=A0A336M242_CULSO